MRVRILGGGWYGCHLALAMVKAGHEVQLHETADKLFSGASGAMPARVHLGFHYPRSRLTRVACQDHYARFMTTYGHLTHGVPLNIYAIARDLSLVDFGNYCQSLEDEVEFIKVERPSELGLRNVEGALMTGERHVVIRKARAWFTQQLKDVVRYGCRPGIHHEFKFDYTIDCTFCAMDGQGVDRYEPCVTGILAGPVDRAITIMDGPFPSLYPWDEEQGLCSLTSASLTPLSKACRTWAEAKEMLDLVTAAETQRRCSEMVAQMAKYYPEVEDSYRVVSHKIAIRAMPLSGADARLVDVVRIDDATLRVRASKLDAIFYAEEIIREMMAC